MEKEEEMQAGGKSFDFHLLHSINSEIVKKENLRARVARILEAGGGEIAFLHTGREGEKPPENV